MCTIQMIEKGKAIPFLIEKSSYEGVKKVTSKVAKDVFCVTGKMPCITDPADVKDMSVSSAIFVSTEGKSPLLEQLEQEGRISLKDIRGKREVYGLFIVENTGIGIERMLVICGSDKRGTIYGLFHLSEHMGVSPLVYWGEAQPMHKEQIVFTQKDEIISKEPSVRYRGFFINDEWPCFGNWTMQHFGGFHADMYDHVFELLLRLKGNYLWPAMWTSSFALDGPDDANEALADCYGIIIGYSHHEPCLRASEEWDIYKGPKSGYGTQWNYVVNKQGLLQYWKDGLIRSGKYENMITIGMRGERDSQMQGANSLEENIELLKDIIANQESLITTYADTKENRHPRLLAIYKEVEKFFYGDEKTPGLKEWDKIKDTLWLFCDDNYGNMRWLPDESMRTHTGGFGMYFHLDYHGSPISYEWINSTPLTKIWEQMTTAYEYGIRDLWIVNVGDLKGNEYPLSYFMDMAYDYERYGIHALNKTREYTKRWLYRQFGEDILSWQVDEMEYLLREMGRVFFLRRPEALSAYTYHPCHYGESNRMISDVQLLQKKAGHLYEVFDPRQRNTFYSMIFYPLSVGCNLILMQLYAGKNQHYAKQGKPVANWYNKAVKRLIEQDRKLASDFAEAFDGKWRGMELASHIGFVKWNEDGCRYPILMEIEPYQKPRMVVSREDKEEIAVKNYGTPEQIIIAEFATGNIEEVTVEIANAGIGSFICNVEMPNCNWLEVDWTQKEIQIQDKLHIRMRPEKLPANREQQTLRITDQETMVEVVCYGKKHFKQEGKIVSLQSDAFIQQKDSKAGYFAVLEDFGVSDVAVKAFPVTKTFDMEDAPVLYYDVMLPTDGIWTLEIWTAPSNPLHVQSHMRMGVSINEENPIVLDTVSSSYEAGNPGCKEWCKGVLEQRHRSYMKIHVNQGKNQIGIMALDAGLTIEKLLLYEKEYDVCYLGPR